MNMTLSKRGDYVMRSAISLARVFDQGGWRKIREVVADTEVPATFASQILADLVRAGLARSKAGRDGGYRLSRAPSDISVLEVIEASEGPLQAERCALGEGPCRWEAVCPLHETWSKATVALRELLVDTSLAEVAVRDAAIEAGTYQTPADSHRAHPLAVAVVDVVQVELAAPEVHAQLARIASALGPLAAQAMADALLDDDAPPAARRQLPAAEVSLVPIGEADASESSEARRYLLAWRLPGSLGLARLEAELSVGAVDPERSEVRVVGTWRQQAGPDSESVLTGPELESRARRTTRLFLRQLAGMVEQVPKSRDVTPARAR
ncbi:MAG TPA: Rrf2 family transcriptional regulator [Acidimicrobiales bacterium]|nr:Rrf2 family transcriptional regulator [Acidimicrobiales bacterium]